MHSVITNQFDDKKVVSNLHVKLSFNGFYLPDSIDIFVLCVM